MATGAFIVPLVGVHSNILAVKRLELDRLRDEIRLERSVVSSQRPDNNSASPKLANLIAYYQLINHTRERPLYTICSVLVQDVQDVQGCHDASTAVKLPQLSSIYLGCLV